MNDTHPSMARKQIELLRAAGPEKRAQLGTALSDSVRWRAMQGLARRHPNLPELERKLLFVELHYGRNLAERVRTYLQSRRA